MQIIISFLLLLPKVLCGFWIAHAIWRDPSPKALWFKFFLGIFLGMGLWSLGYFLWIWIGLSRFVFPWLEIIVSSAVIVLAILTLKLPVGFGPVNFRQLISPLNLTFLFVILITLTLFGMQVYMNPHGYEDTWFIWNLDSRFIYLARDFRILYAPGGPGWHPDYPLMVSLNVVSGWVLLGQDTTRIPMAITVLFTLAIPGTLFSGLALLKDTKQATLAAIVLLSSPLLINEGVGQQADIPVAGFILVSLILVALFFKTQESNLLFLAGLTTSLTAWAKNEGFLFIVINTALLIVFLAASGKIRNIKKYSLGMVIPLSIILFYKLAIPVSNDLVANFKASQLLDLNRYGFILGDLAESISTLGQWPFVSLFIVLLVYALLTWFDFPEPLIVKFVGVALLLQLSGYMVIYVITPHDLAWHIHTSKERLILHIFPAILFLFFYSTNSPNFNLWEVYKNVTRH
jgi:hypothetical protein